ncbi:uncharacterized protein LOC126883165 [Diabrotica virgifera virgifera]|uniref:Uncharacterized protein LOC114335593 n=1 Tax=Diabrotica virgifera virgifera TaxID=50390 RepID=A0A6P7FYI2_DIAVI|nr:uncharacterized protein LOC126883165 [Diabrotica virgifera virgifera]
MQKIPKRSALLDTLHKGFVLSCIGVTIYAGSLFAVRYYNRFIKLKPEKGQELLDRENLLSEGASPDKAPILTV